MAAERERFESEAMEVAQEPTTDAAVLASAASVILSWYFFFVQGNRETGLFVGLWPPTILAFTTHFEVQRIRQRMRHMGTTGSIRRTVEQLVGNR